MYNPSGPSCMRWNVRGFLKINFIGVSSWQRSVSGEHRLCRATLHRHLGGRAHSRLTRDSPEVGIVTERVPPDLPDAGTNGCRLQLSLEDGLLPARKAFVISENPVPGRTPGTVLSKFLQVHRENRIEWQGPGRAFRLCLAHTSLHNSPLDEDIPVLPVE